MALARSASLSLASLRTAAWLGWQTESNWASPWLFALYTVVRPVSAALLLVAMYLVVSGGETQSERFVYVFLGQALFVFVTATVEEVGRTFLDDRERWLTLRYLYVSPVSPYLYLLGRGAARFATASAGVAITLLAGVLFLGLRLDPSGIHYPVVGLGLLFGATASIAAGMCVAAISLVVSRHSWSMANMVAAILHILSGAIFPVDVLPAPLQAISLLLPLTYWLELMRRALAGVSESGLLRPLGLEQVLLALLISTVALLLFTRGLFRLCEWVARDRGLIENTTGD